MTPVFLSWPSRPEGYFLTWDYIEWPGTAVPDPDFIRAIETFDAFEIPLPDPRDGSCPLSTTPVYRLRNALVGGAWCHTTDLVVRATMLALAYVADGYGPEGSVMCALLTADDPENPKGIARPRLAD